MLTTGIHGRQAHTVAPQDTAQAMGSGQLEVYATPAMVALVEESAWKSVQPALEPGQSTVGTRLDLEHSSATPVGMQVWCETELVEIDRRRLVFDCKVYDETGPIAAGTHERFVVDSQRFLQKASAKGQQG